MECIAGIDTIKLKSEFKPGDISKISGIPDHHLLPGHPFVKGRLSNLRVHINETGTLIEGSLPRYYLGSNCYTLTPATTKEALGQLSDDLSLDLSQAQVKGFDYGKNINLTHPPGLYFKCLGDSKQLTTKGYIQKKTTTLYYSNGKRGNNASGNIELVFYDKIQEAGRNKTPKEWESLNVMRVELCYTHKPQKQLKQEIQGDTLYDPTFIQKVNENYIYAYNSIYKIYPFTLNLSPGLTPGQVLEQITAYGIDALGFENSLALIEELKAKGLLKCREYVSTLKKEIKDLYSNCCPGDKSYLIDELTGQIISGVPALAYNK